jgi:hypothetical protein
VCDRAGKAISTGSELSAAFYEKRRSRLENAGEVCGARMRAEKCFLDEFSLLKTQPMIPLPCFVDASILKQLGLINFAL